ERGIGTSIRFFDSKTRMWRVVFVSPEYNALVTLEGGVEGNRIVLRGVNDEGSRLRWSFNDIQADSFVWRGEESRDGGKSWRLEEEHHMKRRKASRQYGQHGWNSIVTKSRRQNEQEDWICSPQAAGAGIDRS